MGKFNASYRREPFYTFGNKMSVFGIIDRIIKRRGLPLVNRILNKYGKGIISYKYNYDKLWSAICENSFSSNSIPGVVADWDNTARKGYNGQVLTGVTVEKFIKYFMILLEKCDSNNVPFVMINAWNEWAEGAYLEPDQSNGYEFLEAIRKVVYR